MAQATVNGLASRARIVTMAWRRQRMRSFHIDVLETLVPTNTCPSVSLRNRFPLVVVGGGVCEELIGFVCERDEISHWAHFFFSSIFPHRHIFFISSTVFAISSLRSNQLRNVQRTRAKQILSVQQTAPPESSLGPVRLHAFRCNIHVASRDPLELFK